FGATGLDRPFIGVPAYVWIWSAIGCVAAILMRACQITQSNYYPSLRWLLYRPVVGISMGVMLYLFAKTGLVVLASPANAVGDVRLELLYLFSFLGGFSDSLSASVLDRLMGSFITPPRP